MKKLVLIVTLLLSTLTPVLAQTPAEDKSPRFIIHLLDYLAHDYGGAVQNGKVVSPSEYDEQVEFAQKVNEIATALPEINSNKLVFEKISKLKKLIDTKADAKDVALTARDIQKDLIAVAKVALAPQAWPSITNGKKLYQANCIACHGAEGKGDGASGAGMDPAPANFHDTERMSQISAFHNYNTIRLGVPGTGMASFPDFTDKEVWDLSFYLMSIRHEGEAKAALASGEALKKASEVVTLEEAASLSDTELQAKMNLTEEKEKTQAVAVLRMKDNNPTGGDYIGKAKDLLGDSQRAFDKNTAESRELAKTLAIRAYLEGIEPLEPMLKANNPELVVTIETEMTKMRQIISDPAGTSEALAAQIKIVHGVFTEVESSIQSKELSFGVAFSGAFAIILREGFEAVLIVLTLLSVIKAFGSRKAAVYVHAGWGSALGLGFIAWFLSGALMQMSGASREVLEAATSTLAVVILLYFGFWLHRQTEISRWKKFIQEKVQGALDSKNLWALASISFISVFREAFETVLFIRALWFQTNAEGKNAIGLGLVSALVLIFAFSFVALKYSKKIPVRELFKVSSVLTSLLAFILAGKAVHSLQEAGILNTTLMPWNLRFDTIGLFPTWQTTVAQALTLILVFALIKYNSRPVQQVETVTE